MKTIVITGVIVLLVFCLFVWFIRLTRRDKPKKLKIVHQLNP